MGFFYGLRDFMSNFKIRLITLIIGYILGGSAAYYFWRLTLLIDDGTNKSFLVKVWDYYWNSNNPGVFFLALFVFIIGWIITLIPVIFEFVYTIADWSSMPLWANIARLISVLVLFAPIYYFFAKSLLILISVIIFGAIAMFVLHVFFSSDR